MLEPATIVISPRCLFILIGSGDFRYLLVEIPVTVAMTTGFADNTWELASQQGWSESLKGNFYIVCSPNCLVRASLCISSQREADLDSGKKLADWLNFRGHPILTRWNQLLSFFVSFSRPKSATSIKSDGLPNKICINGLTRLIALMLIGTPFDQWVASY